MWSVEKNCNSKEGRSHTKIGLRKKIAMGKKNRRRVKIACNQNKCNAEGSNKRTLWGATKQFIEYGHLSTGEREENEGISTTKIQRSQKLKPV